MKFNVAINGYGRIGRCILRALFESEYFHSKLRIVAINELADLEKIAHLTKYDTTHGRFSAEVNTEMSNLVVNGEQIAVLPNPTHHDFPGKRSV